MTLRRLAALTSYWDEAPPTHILVRALTQAFGGERKVRASAQEQISVPGADGLAGSESQIEQLMAMFPRSPFPLPKPMLPEEYLRQRKEALDGLQQ